MSQPIIPVPIPSEGGDSAALLQSLQTQHADDSVNLGGIAPAPNDDAPESDADKLSRAKPGRKRSPISKHRTKPELLAAAREQETRIKELETQLGVGESGASGPGPMGMTPAELDRSMTIALEQTIALASNIAAAHYGPDMLVPKDERDILRDAWLPIARHYAPKAGAALPWIGALSATAMVVLPRVNAARASRASAAPQVQEPKSETTAGRAVVTTPEPAPPPAPPRRRGDGPPERAAYTGESAVAPPSRTIDKDGNVTEHTP